VQAVATRLADGRRILWRPHPGPQTRFVTTRCHEVLYGGSAGGGKSAGLISIPLRWVKNPNFSALILRRDTTQLGDLLKKAEKVYPAAGGRPTKDGASVTWRFRSGATVWFTHCQHEDDVARFDGWEFQLVEFDELTHFTEQQYTGIRARIRTPHPGLPRYTRSTSNPGGVGHKWVFRRWGPWLDPNCRMSGVPAGDGKKPPVEPGVVLWYAVRNGVEVCVKEGELGDKDIPALSRTFIPAKLRDNPSLAVNDPTYAANIAQLDPVRRKQLEDGDWLASYTAGSLFRREWWKFIDKPPAEVLSRWRAWDRAATAPHDGNKDPDWTRGVKISRAGPLFFVEDMVSMRDGPHPVRKLMRNTAEMDGFDTSIALFRDPGSAGKDEEASMLELLAGFNVHSDVATGDKVSRARPFSAQAQPGNVYLIRGAWNEEFIQELEQFPTEAEGVHDDIVDASSSAFSRVAPVSDLEFFNQISTLR
jgi:predicted phage terminase large subunit-like protein